MFANLLNWSIGGVFMRSCSVMVRIPKHILVPSVVLLTLTAIYVQETSMAVILFAIGFGLLGYLMRRLDISVLPFVISFILAGNLETLMRQSFSATGGDPWFLFASPLAVTFMVVSILVVIYYGRGRSGMQGAP